MRHKKATKKLRRNPAHRKALFRNLLLALFTHDKIVTTVAKAKAVRRLAEKLITKAKKDTVHSRRMAFRVLQDKKVVKRLFEVIAVKYIDRNGGYTRVLKLSKRRAGDAAELALLELVEPGSGRKQEVSMENK